MSRSSTIAAVALIGIGIVIGVILMTSVGENALQKAFAAGSIGSSSAPMQAPESVRALNNQFVAVSEATTKSVVYISAKVSRDVASPFPDDFFRFFGPNPNDDEQPQQEEGEAAGSGVIISYDGYIVTNNHVVEHAKEGSITVTTHDEKEFKAKLIGRDPLTDLAVLKIDGEFQPAHLAEKKDIRVGEWVIAVGNPLGLRSTVTSGIISAMGRGIGIVGTNERTFERNRYAVENFIQTDAAINPGNSGGGLFNMNGSLVGINTAIASRSGVNAGYGFAIPIDMVKSVAEDLIDDGKIERGYIGIEITSIDETSAKAAGLNKVSGVLVNRVVKGGAAASAGIEVGDVVLKVDNDPVRTSNDLQNQIVLRHAGDKVNLTIWRDGKEIVKSVKLKALDSDNNIVDNAHSGETVGKSDASPLKFQEYGFTAAPLTKQQRDEFDTDIGVVVAKIDNRGAVARRGMRPNTVILKADGQSVSTPEQLKKILDKKRPGDGVLFVVKDKDGSKQAVTVEVPES